MALRAIARFALLGALRLAGAGGLVLSDADRAGTPNDRTSAGAGAPAVNETLYAFIHIPKCAGSSFLDCLNLRLWLGDAKAGQEPLRHIFPPTAWKNGQRSSNSWNAKGCGQSTSVGPTHCSVGEIHDCLSSGYADMDGVRYDPKQMATRYFTILRHPVARVLSEFYWWRNPKRLLGGHWPEELEAEAMHGLAKWVRSPYNVAHNRMVKQLTATGALAPIRRPLGTECMTMDMQYYQQYWMSKYNLSLENGLEAKINADVSLVDEAERSLWFAGTQEDLIASASRLLRLFGEQPVENSSKHMRFCTHKIHTSDGPVGEVPEDVVREIEERNELDMELYRRHAAGAGAGQARNLRQRLGDLKGQNAGRLWTWEEVMQDDLD